MQSLGPDQRAPWRARPGNDGREVSKGGGHAGEVLGLSEQVMGRRAASPRGRGQQAVEAVLSSELFRT